METRDYMRARFGYIETLMTHDTVDAIGMSLSHQLDMLRLCRGDNMRIRDQTPHLMLRLGRDQEAYDFMKWWAATAENSGYDWDGVELSHINLKGEDAFEEVGKFAKRFGSFSHKTAVSLLKVRLYLDLCDLRNADCVFKNIFPQEVTDKIKRHVVRTDVVAARRDLVEKTGVTTGPLMETLRKQIKTMAKNVTETNKHMWPGILSPQTVPDALPDALPDAYTMGSREEMTLTWAHCYPAWMENPGSLAVIKRAGALARPGSAGLHTALQNTRGVVVEGKGDM